MPTPPSPDLIARFAAIVGERNAITAPQALAPYLEEWRGQHHGVSPLVLRPGNSAEVAAIMALASETDTGIVPQGGNTGLVGGQIPLAGEVVVQLGRLDRIRAVDPDGNTLTAEAGVVLASAQAAAAGAGRRLPLTFGAEGTAEIGGAIATNAGGTAVLAYGNARALVLGLEVVLAGGTVLDGLRGLRKDNAGYDWKHLFIGSEGTLGIITAAVLKLVPPPAAKIVALAGVPNPAAAVELLNRALGAFGSRLTAVELIPRVAVELAAKHLPGVRDPFLEPHPWYVLIEDGGDDPVALAVRMEALLAAAIEANIVRNALIAGTEAQADMLWRLRHGLSEAQKAEGASLKHDVAVPVAAVPALIAEVCAAVEAIAPGCRPVPFGHLGDGSIHFNISPPAEARGEGPPSAASGRSPVATAFLAQRDVIATTIHAAVARRGGSIAAEHGIGIAKAPLLQQVRSAAEMALMRALKRTLDPKGILNPGKVLAL